MTTEPLSQRERNKLEKRSRILAVAKHIIAHEGIEALTMRHLADVAELSSRTPYNLYGSKTAILLAIRFENIQALQALGEVESDGIALKQLFDRLGSILAMPEAEEAFHRSVHWAIMRSDDLESKQRARGALVSLIAGPLLQARDAGELALEVDGDTVDGVAEHLVILLAAVLGMWADSQLTLEDAIGHIRLSWLNALAPYSQGVALDYLREQLNAIRQGSPAHLPVAFDQ